MKNFAFVIVLLEDFKILGCCCCLDILSPQRIFSRSLSVGKQLLGNSDRARVDFFPKERRQVWYIRGKMTDRLNVVQFS